MNAAEYGVNRAIFFTTKIAFALGIHTFFNQGRAQRPYYPENKVS